MLISECWQIQRTLSQVQAVPIIGSTLVSPIKAAFSLAQLIVGVAGAILLGNLAIVTSDRYVTELSLKCFPHIGMGLISFMYSVSNFITLGFIGFSTEIMHRNIVTLDLQCACTGCSVEVSR